MNKHVAESYMFASHPRQLVEQISTCVAGLCEAIAGSDRECMLVFNPGDAILRAIEGSLLLRVSANNVVACRSLQTVIESSLFENKSGAPAEIRWFPGEDTPFVVVERLLAKLQTSTASE
ncbi:hypothetical protein I6F26_32715 [Ensifer sp. IC3342]|nr:hypothetical protein [Ensifer sp. BRP08]MCA1451200.1 hypothetical protein [Ensifer sp. IC3342]